MSTTYARTITRCNDYFSRIRRKSQDFRAQLVSEQAARAVFKERYGRIARNPYQYIQTEEEANEYFETYKKFLDLYQEILTTKEI